MGRCPLRVRFISPDWRLDNDMAPPQPRFCTLDEASSMSRLGGCQNHQLHDADLSQVHRIAQSRCNVGRDFELLHHCSLGCLWGYRVAEREHLLAWQQPTTDCRQPHLACGPDNILPAHFPTAFKTTRDNSQHKLPWYFMNACDLGLLCMFAKCILKGIVVGVGEFAYGPIARVPPCGRQGTGRGRPRKARPRVVP